MISVCIASYNGGKYIERQVSSILSQLGKDDEVVVSDDGSTDKTLAILSAFNDKRVRVIEGPHRHSPKLNFENALLNAKGDYIFLSDQDDEWMPNKVKVCMEYLKNYDCVITDNIIVDGDDAIISESFYQLNKTRNGRWYNLLIKNGYLGCCMAFQRKVLNKAVPFPSHIPMHDIWIGNVSAFKYSLIFIPDKLIKYCRHGDNASPTAETSTYSIFKRLGFRWDIFKNIVCR